MMRRLIVLAVAIGGVGIAACSDGTPASLENNEILSITIENPCRVIEEGNVCNMVATAFSEGGFEVSNPAIFWSSSNPSVAAVQASDQRREIGVVQGVGGGNAVITVTNADGDVTGQTQIQVVEIEEEDPCPQCI